MTFDCELHAAGHAAIGGNPRERDVDELAYVALDEGGGFEHGGEDLRVNPVPAVVDAGVEPGEAHDLVRRAGEKARPDF